jgi:hypothetical protein
MYKVSVVTPFHNVDMDMFQKCADGMRCQTIGFENIEWIIVVHNCQPHYLTTVPTRQYLINAKGQLVPCTDHHLLP